MPKSTLVTIVKDEGPYLWEWVAYHRVIGFDDIVVFENDSTDLSPGLLRQLAKAGYIHHYHNSAPKDMHQIRAYRRATGLECYTSADWVLAIDLDEFLAIKVGDGKILDLMEAASEFDCLLINWRLFGNSFQDRMEPGLVTERFVLANRADLLKTNSLGHKGFFRPQRFRRAGVHFPVMSRPFEDVRIGGGSGLPLTEPLPETWRSHDQGCQSWVQVNHYAVKDTESFIQKTGRGRAHQSHNQVHYRYWRRNNRNDVVDVTVLQHMKELRAEMAAMDAACGGELSRITRVSRGVHRKVIDRRLQAPDYARLFNQCARQSGAAKIASHITKP